MKENVQILDKNSKTKKLLLSIVLDLIGMLSFSIPLIGEFSDVVWAPLAAYCMTRMYKGSIGKIGGVITFLEEILPFTDVIPTFTLTWIYTYVIKKSN
jgi:hypothetical protein